MHRDGSWRSAKRDERFQVMKKIFEQEEFPLVWYDEAKNLYAMQNLTLNHQREYQCEIKHKKTGRINKFRFLIVNLVKTSQLKSLFDFIEKRLSIRPSDSIQIIETLFKQWQRSQMINIKNQFYAKDQKLDDLGESKIFLLEKEKFCFHF